MSEKVVAVSRENAGFFLDIFRYYCVIGSVVNREIYTVSWAAFSQLMKDIGIVNRAGLKLADLDRIFIAANFQVGPSPRSKSLDRPAFIEACIRTALEFYAKKSEDGTNESHKVGTALSSDADGKEPESPEEIVRRFIAEKLQNAKSLRCQLFRSEVLYRISMDFLLQNQRANLDIAYHRYAGKLQDPLPPGQRFLLNLAEFYELLKDAKLLNEDYLRRDAAFAFRASIRPTHATTEEERNSSKGKWSLCPQMIVVG